MRLKTACRFSSTLLCLSAVAGLTLFTPARASEGEIGDPGDVAEFNPAEVNLADLIACRTDVPTWLQFSTWFVDKKEASAALGIRPVKSDNPFLSSYQVTRPLTVFGRQTSEIVFTSAGVMAVLTGVTPQALAAELEVKPALDFGGKYLGERVISETALDTEPTKLSGTERIALNVSTVTDLPGRVLAGCSYQVTIDDGETTAGSTG